MADKKFLDLIGLTSFKNKIVSLYNSHTSNNDIHTSSEEKNKLSAAYSHSTSAHAPTDAEKNIIVGVQKNGSDVSVNSSTRKVDIIVPTKVSELTNDENYVKESSLMNTNGAQALLSYLPQSSETSKDEDIYAVATSTDTGMGGFISKPLISLWNYIQSKLSTVATSGSYDDLSNKPTIPTVGNGTITIKQAGTTKGTFSTNQSGDTTIELTDNNTTYSAATTSANGLMTSTMVTKLDGIATGAEVNQNAFSKVVVGSTYVNADSATDTLTLAGSNVTLTPDATNDKVTIGITKANVTSALGYVPPTPSGTMLVNFYRNASSTSTQGRYVTLVFPYVGSVSPCYPKDLIRITVYHNASSTSGFGCAVLVSASISSNPEFDTLGGETLSITSHEVSFDEENMICTLKLKIAVRPYGLLVVEHTGATTCTITSS